MSYAKEDSFQRIRTRTRSPLSRNRAQVWRNRRNEVRRIRNRCRIPQTKKLLQINSESWLRLETGWERFTFNQITKGSEMFLLPLSLLLLLLLLQSISRRTSGKKKFLQKIRRERWRRRERERERKEKITALNSVWRGCETTVINCSYVQLINSNFWIFYLVLYFWNFIK